MEEFLRDNILLLVPFIVINYILVIIAIVDLFRTERPIRGNKVLWLLVVLFVNPIGAIAYLLFGKGD